MDEAKIYRDVPTKKIHPIERANFLSRYFFCYLLPFFRKGLKREHGENDMYQLSNSNLSAHLADKLQRTWQDQLKKKKHPSLVWAMAIAFKWEMIKFAFVNSTLELIRLGQPLMISQLISYYGPESAGKNMNDTYLYGSLLILVIFTSVLFIHNFQLRMMEMGARFRVAACAVIYRKALRLSKSSMTDTTIGQMVNLISNDVSRFEWSCQQINNLWFAPIQCVIIMYLLYIYVGPTGMVGATFLIAFMPLQMYMGKKTSDFRLRTALRTDERVRLMNEMISGIQIIKVYTWEKPFIKLVEFTRRLEMKHIRATSVIRGLVISFNQVLHRFAIFLCILTYVLTGSTMNATYAYTITSFHAILRNSVVKFFPKAVTQLAETMVSAKRIEKFLLYEELEKETFSNGVDKSNVQKESPCVSVKNACVKWLPTLSDWSISDITLSVRPGQIVAIVGPVGGGKTTLLHMILKELPAEVGSVDVRGTVSYCSQESWVFRGNIRQNILFGQQYDENRYKEVVRVCALERDFRLFPQGDQTFVGERGVTLSGGQRARINLARAIYREADIYLLDDPLSAVDAHVGKKLFIDCITGYLRRKCVILVTHQLQYLRDVNRIYFLEGGKIKAEGTYEELSKSDNQFSTLLSKSEEEEKKAEEEFRRKSQLKETDSTPPKDESPKQEQEFRASGSVTLQVYKDYFNAGGNSFRTASLFLAFILAQVFASGTDYFLSLWVNAQQVLSENSNMNPGVSNETSFSGPSLENQTSLPSAENATDGKILGKIRSLLMEIVSANDYSLTIYSCIIALTIIFTIVACLEFVRYCMKASTKLHNKMFDKIVYSPMTFFNDNPSGRILNRFSRDIGNVDETLPVTMIDTIHIGVNVVAVSVVIGSLNPWIFIPMVVIIILFYIIRQVFLASSRPIKRIEAVTRSPIYTHLGQSLQGLTTIRASAAQEILITEFDNYQDANTAAYYLFLTANRTFGFWMDFHCVVFIALVIVSLLFIQKETFGGNIGLALTQSMTLTGMFQFGMRQWSELENQMTSVERVQEYTDLNAELNDTPKISPKNWPDSGKVAFKNVFLRYSPESSPVLKNVSFEVQPREKIGIVGRTGAGKSSLIQALFRLTNIDGEIIIDGVDTKTIPLNVLRSKISIIPQEPVLFSGTVRRNLDPFDEYSDEILWNALAEVELKTVVSDLPAGLDSKMAEGGSNFSVGQRQLVCLARAILRKNKILVLDEATANIDPQTDALIQSTIRRKFENCTVFTIAHRLLTIMNSDKVLVMDAGQSVEFDHPYLLLQNSEGFFAKLVEQTGPAAENLKKIAIESFRSL